MSARRQRGLAGTPPVPTTRKRLLKAVGSPYFFLRATPRTLIADADYGVASNVVVKLRGKKCRNYGAFMDELGAAFQVFYGFGENWSAVAEVLREMDEWLPGDGYVVVVEHAEDLHCEEPVELATLMRILSMVGDAWSKAIVGNDRFDRPPRPFHVIFETADPSFEGRLRALGHELVALA